MQATHPLSLLLVVLLAFWTPMSQCCAAAVKANVPAPVEQAQENPPCHPPQPSEESDGQPCHSEDTCDCTPLMRSVCQNDRTSSTATPASGSIQLPPMTAILLPASMQPHTFARRLAGPPPEATPPPATAPSLVALNCQLTL